MGVTGGGGEMQRRIIFLSTRAMSSMPALSARDAASNTCACRHIISGIHIHTRNAYTYSHRIGDMSSMPALSARDAASSTFTQTHT